MDPGQWFQSGRGFPSKNPVGFSDVFRVHVGHDLAMHWYAFVIRWVQVPLAEIRRDRPGDLRQCELCM